MKKMILLLIGLLLVTVTRAQIDFGIKGGINTGWIKMDDVITVEEGVEEYSLEGASNLTVGFHGGLQLRITLFRAYLQPEIYFSSTKGEVTVKDLTEFTGRNEWVETLEFGRIDIPVMVGYKAGPVRLQLGPVASILISENAELLDFEDYKEKYKAATIGFQAGAGIDIIKKITLDLRYEGNLSKLGDSIKIGSGDPINLDTRASQLVISLGVLF